MSEATPEEIFQKAPVIAIMRDPDNLWRAEKITENRIRLKILEGVTSKTDILHEYVFSDDQDIITRKLGAAILAKKSEVELRYRVRKGRQYQWIEDHCILSYHESGDIKSAYSYLWISSLPAEWHLLLRGCVIWNELTSKVRHDILNQLTAILGYLELSEDLITDPMIKDFAKKEQNAAEKIRERLIFTREYQKIGLSEFTWFSVSDIIKESLNEISLHPVTLEMNVGDARIYGDKNIRLALEKILENIPFHAKGATILKIKLQRSANGGILIIEDNGCGIPDTLKNRIFDLGFGSKGGNGLFLAEKILSVFEIKIQEKGIPGHSARFELTIPSDILDIPA